VAIPRIFKRGTLGSFCDNLFTLRVARMGGWTRVPVRAAQQFSRTDRALDTLAVERHDGRLLV
jgi:hypothetical protein